LYPRNVHIIVNTKDTNAPKFAQSVGEMPGRGFRKFTIKDAIPTLIRKALPLTAKNLINSLPH
jgi:hypothetical protein